MMSRNNKAYVNDYGEENVYYNIRIENDQEVPINANFSENRVQPILDKPDHYELAVVRFTIPAYAIPIMFFRDDTGEYKDEFYSITMSYDGHDENERLIFIPNDDGTPDIYPGKKAIWFYQELVDSLNNALSTAFTNMKIAKPLAPPTEAPFMTFDPVTQLFSLYAEQLYDTDSLTPTIEIFMNPILFKLFSTLRVIERDVAVPPYFEKNFQLVIKNNKLNTTTYNAKDYYIMTQDNTTLYLWNDLQTILFETNTIPINPEFLSTQNNTVRRVITDFEPLSDVSSHQVIQFYPQGPLRYYDLKSNYPLNQLDLRVLWADSKQRTFPVKLTNGDVLTCKLLFRKRGDKILHNVLRNVDEEE